MAECLNFIWERSSFRACSDVWVHGEFSRITLRHLNFANAIKYSSHRLWYEIDYHFVPECVRHCYCSSQMY